ncbi:MAG: hypothetical protein GWO41_08325 [candidate division Zixibacteria bacterium]|nr:hypothetical protein [candidate division Zixibacteria bacterium]NIT52728.1 hypothetical protein [candidate division Zixibacteria bacterium]NIV04834.1 hypothetical protein [candidate division Zixibacteria bacterium]NIX57272.1 hypothetical protein [candidate division Zixibacteria bacterium]NIX79671.1 hypothetical protein [candidate division Zixibacteria bacterium]
MDHATSGMTGKSKKAVELILELWNGDVAQGPYEQIHAVQVITAAVHYLNGVDVLAEIRAARANWPNDRPVYDAGRNSLHPYLVSWFRNAQERGDRSKTGSQAGHTSKPQGFSLLEIGRHIQIDRPFPEQFGEIVRIINTAVEDGVLMPSQIYSWLDDCAKAENPAFSMRNKKIVDFDPQDNRKPSEIAAGVFRPVSGKRVEDLIASMPIMGKKIGGQK